MLYSNVFDFGGCGTLITQIVQTSVTEVTEVVHKLMYIIE